jgi:PTS system N-acetylglucosamine-specific IIB component
VHHPAAHRGPGPDVVDEAALKAAGAHGVIRAGSVVQVVVGPEADNLAEDIEDLM